MWYWGADKSLGQSKTVVHSCNAYRIAEFGRTNRGLIRLFTREMAWSAGMCAPKQYAKTFGKFTAWWAERAPFGHANLAPMASISCNFFSFFDQIAWENPRVMLFELVLFLWAYALSHSILTSFHFSLKNWLVRRGSHHAILAYLIRR